MYIYIQLPAANPPPCPDTGHGREEVSDMFVSSRSIYVYIYIDISGREIIHVHTAHAQERSHTFLMSLLYFSYGFSDFLMVSLAFCFPIFFVPCIAMDCHMLPCTALEYPLLPWSTLSYHGLPSPTMEDIYIYIY